MPSRRLFRSAVLRCATRILATACWVGSALAPPPSHAGTRAVSQAGTFTIEVQQSGGGVVTPDGPVPVLAGGESRFDIVPDDCFTVADVVVDDASVGSVSSYTFTNVQADRDRARQSPTSKLTACRWGP